MLISIITPFKKGRSYLKDCLESVKAQSMRVYDSAQTAKAAAEQSASEQWVTNDEDTFHADPAEGMNSFGISYKTVPFRNFELILVLDHPEEDVSDLIAEYEKEFTLKTVDLAAYAHQTQGSAPAVLQNDVKASHETGVAAARNAGMENAEGDYIFFLDSDDHLFPRALSFIERSIIYGAEPDLIYCDKIISWIRRDKYEEVFAKHLARIRAAAEQGSIDDVNDADESEGSDDTGEGADDGDSEGDDSAASGSADTADSDKEDTIADEGLYANASEEELLAHADDIVKMIRKGEVPENSDDVSRLHDILTERLNASEYEDYARNKAAYELISQRKGIRNISALGIAYKRTLIAGNDIRFPENQRYYADLEFVSRAIDCAHTFRKDHACRYIKRRHDEQSSFPSIMDEVAPERFEQYIASYTDTRDKLTGDGITAWRLDDKLINYYADYYTKMMVTRKAEHWKTTRFEMMQNALSRIPAGHAAKLPLFKRKVVAALIAGEPERVCRIRNRRDADRAFVRKLKRSFAWIGGGKR